MRQFTNGKQTVKLVKLGFKTKTYAEDDEHQVDIRLRPTFFFGDLIEMLIKPHCRVSIISAGLGLYKVVFKKLINRKFKVLFHEVGDEPIDLLFNCIVKLKEEE